MAALFTRKRKIKHWKDFYEVSPNQQTYTDDVVGINNKGSDFLHKQPDVEFPLMQIHKSYIVAQRQSGFLLVHQQNAHERVLYERYLHAVAGKPIATQQSLFPTTLELSATDAVLLQELLPDMKELGYQLEPFGQHTFVLQGTPADIDSGDEKSAIEKIIEQYLRQGRQVQATV